VLVWDAAVQLILNICRKTEDVLN